MNSSESRLLSVRDLSVWLSTRGGPLEVVKGIKLDVNRGECVALVGESGSGKSVTARSILGLLPRANSQVEGEVILDGYEGNLLAAPEKTRTRMRGRSVTMVSQDPMTSLDPVARVSDQLRDTIRLRNPSLGKEEIRLRSLRILEDVGIADPASTLRAWPHELSGGMRQRVAIALAIVHSPGLLVADEPTTALDVTVQAQVLRMLQSIQKRTGMGVLLITHDMTVVRQMAHRVAVMLKGQVVEFGPVDQVLDKPTHPYTRGLISSTVTMNTLRSQPLKTVASFMYETAGDGR